MSDSVLPNRRQPTRLPHPWDSLGKNTGVGCHFLLQYLCLQSFKNLKWLLRWLSGKDSTCQCQRHKRHGFSLCVWKIPWRKKWQPTPIFLLGEFHGQRTLLGYSPGSHTELDTTERLSTQKFKKPFLAQKVKCQSLSNCV